MPHNIPSPLPGLPRAAPRAGAAPVRLALELLLLALLRHLFPRLRLSTPVATPLDLPEPEYRPSYCYDVYGRAPHAAVVALGLVPDWVLVGGPRPRHAPWPARAPPAPPHPRRTRPAPAFFMPSRSPRERTHQSLRYRI